MYVCMYVCIHIYIYIYMYIYIYIYIHTYMYDSYRYREREELGRLLLKPLLMMLDGRLAHAVVQVFLLLHSF